MPKPMKPRTDSELSASDIFGLWDKGILSWKLWPQQYEIYQRIRTLSPELWLFVILCARQYGKSVLAILMGIEDCLRCPDSGVLIIGPTIDQTWAIVEPRMRLLTRDAPPGLIRQIKSEKKYLIGDSELYIGGFDRVSAGQRGKTLKNIYIEEVRDSHPDKYTRTMRGDLGPALIHSNGGRLNFVTTLPDIPDHPFITETMEQAKLSNAFASYTIDDNAALTATEKERAIAMSGGIDSDETKRELYNIQTRNRKRTIAPDYDEAIHVAEFQLPSAAFLQMTADWGGTRDKTVGLLHTYDFINNMILIWDERVFQENTPTPVIIDGGRSIDGAAIEGLKDMEHGYDELHQRTIDAAGQTLVDIGAEKVDGGHDYEAFLPPKVDWDAAANNLSAIFTPRPANILIHPRCVFLRATMRSGMFNLRRTDFDRTDTLGHMDAAAALMYAIRVQDRTSPLGPQHTVEGVGLNQYIPPKKSEDSILADTLQPKTFASASFSGQFGVKKFGRFGQ